MLNVPLPQSCAPTVEAADNTAMRIRTAAAAFAAAAAIIPAAAGCSTGGDTPETSATPLPAPETQPTPEISIVEVPPVTGEGVDRLTPNQSDAIADMEGFVPNLDADPAFVAVFGSPTTAELNPGSDYALKVLISASGLAQYGLDGWSSVAVESPDGLGTVTNPQKADVTVSPGLTGDRWQVTLASPQSTVCVNLPDQPAGPVQVADGACPEGSEQAALDTLTAIVNASFASEGIDPADVG